MSWISANAGRRQAQIKRRLGEPLRVDLRAVHERGKQIIDEVGRRDPHDLRSHARSPAASQSWSLEATAITGTEVIIDGGRSDSMTSTNLNTLHVVDARG